jgi:thiol-disulfide isomerase/thioredoxin
VTGTPGDCSIAAAPAGFQYPAGPYGQEVGNIFDPSGVEGLKDCDNEPVHFLDVFASARLVLLNVGAGWCTPCEAENERIVEDIHDPFCGRGLRIVEVLFQDADAGPETSLHCREWRDRFGLTFPVLKDPTFKTMAYFEGGSQTPLNLLIDRAGVIRFRETAIAPPGLDAVIDALLRQASR